MSMAVDLQASMDMLSKIDWNVVKEKVEDYAPVFAVIRNTWTHETLQEISEGKVFVSDDMLNEILSQNISEESPIAAARIASKDTGRLNIYAELKDLGKVEFSGTIEECVCNEKGAHISYRVRERELLGKGFNSWLFSRISLSMTQKIMGGLNFSGEVPTKIHHNTITVDLTKALEESELAKTRFRGYRLIDMVQIEGAQPKQGGIEIDTALKVPDEIKEALLGILK